MKLLRKNIVSLFCILPFLSLNCTLAVRFIHFISIEIGAGQLSQLYNFSIKYSLMKIYFDEVRMY